MFSPSRAQSIDHSQIKAAASAARSPIPAMFHDAHMGPFSPNHTLAEGRRFFRTRSAAEAKMWHANESG
jgi:hypothetical protein